MDKEVYRNKNVIGTVKIINVDWNLHAFITILFKNFTYSWSYIIHVFEWVKLDYAESRTIFATQILKKKKLGHCVKWTSKQNAIISKTIWIQYRFSIFNNI